MMRILLLTIAAALCSASFAQPDWLRKATPSIAKLNTFTSDGTLLASSNAFFVGETGEAVSCFAPFDGASRAVVIDAKGREMPVECILGANATYDVAKFRVEAKRTTPLNVASSQAKQSDMLWIVAYSPSKKPAYTQATVVKTEAVQDSNAYYTLTANTADGLEGSPLFNANGEVTGIMQRSYDTADKNAYAVGAPLAMALKTNGLSLNDASLKRIGIKKALPDELAQAQLMLYVAASVLDSAAYSDIVDDFIAQYPSATDGYVSKAQICVSAGNIAEADRLMRQAVEQSDRKDDAHYNYARLILATATDPKLPADDTWTLDKAIAQAQAAYSERPVAVYRQLEAQALAASRRYDEACTIYEELANGPLRNAETFLAAAQCKELLGDTAASIALLDSAVATFSRPYLKAAAPYILARAQALLAQKSYRKAVADFNEYEQLMQTEVNANFYYVRALAEIDGHIFQAAINDLAKAVEMEPRNTLFLAEKASLEVRLGLFDDAIATSQRCIEADAGQSDGYLFLGLAQCLSGNKAEGALNLQRAKELGNPQAQALIDRYVDGSAQ